jgi:hypothetical protein
MKKYLVELRLLFSRKAKYMTPASKNGNRLQNWLPLAMFTLFTVSSRLNLESLYITLSEPKNGCIPLTQPIATLFS